MKSQEIIDFLIKLFKEYKAGIIDKEIVYERAEMLVTDNKLEYSENTKLLYTTLLREMEFRNMIPEGITLEEKGIKAYGFTKFAIKKYY